jgi:hypothetical protein
MHLAEELPRRRTIVSAPQASSAWISPSSGAANAKSPQSGEDLALMKSAGDLADPAEVRVFPLDQM